MGQSTPRSLEADPIDPPELLPSEFDGNLDVYFPCPACAMYFHVWQGFIVHMVVEHWWEREEADAYWKQAVLSQQAA